MGLKSWNSYSNVHPAWVTTNDDIVTQSRFIAVNRSRHHIPCSHEYTRTHMLQVTNLWFYRRYVWFTITIQKELPCRSWYNCQAFDNINRHIFFRLFVASVLQTIHYYFVVCLFKSLIKIVHVANPHMFFCDGLPRSVKIRL